MLIEDAEEFGHHFQAFNAQIEMVAPNPLTMSGAAPLRQAMSREETQPRFKPWLLALALATILTWYILNPAPGATCQFRKESDAHDNERRQARADEVYLQFGREPAFHSVAAADEALPEWPKYIELD